MGKLPFWKDSGLWILLGFNGAAFYFYYENPNSISTLYVLFWIQSFFIGVFTVLGILTFNNRVANSFTVNDNPGNQPGCAAGFFALHYGIFHFVYLIFVLTSLVNYKHLEWTFIKLSFWAIFAGCIMQYFQDKNRNRTQPVNIGTMFFMPYARIIPMHLAILGPQFLHIKAPIIFLLLKIFADVIMHLVYRNYLFKTDPENK